MVPSARRRALAVLPLAVLLALSGCERGQPLKALHDAIVGIVVFVVGALVLQVVVVAVGLVGAVKLEDGTPSLRWGIAAIVCGLLQIVPTAFLLLLATPGGLLAISVIEVIALAYVGIRNVMLAPRRPAATLRDSDPPDDLA